MISVLVTPWLSSAWTPDALEAAGASQGGQGCGRCLSHVVSPLNCVNTWHRSVPRISFHQLALDFMVGVSSSSSAVSWRVEQEEFLDLLHAGKLLVHPADLVLDQFLHFRARVKLA